MSQDHNHLNHATWERKCHVVFTAKYRRKVLFGQIRRHFGSVFHELAGTRNAGIEEGHLMPDHVQQKSGDRGQASGSAAIEALRLYEVSSLVPNPL
jgi:hypothetical protein